MISKISKFYCCEDLSLIENYDKAMDDMTQIWDCHHRLETELNVCVQYLIDNDLYLNRPPSELIFLTRSEHTRLHRIKCNKVHKYNNKHKSKRLAKYLSRFN